MLHKFEWEVLEQCPPDEFVRWLIYIDEKEKVRKRQESKNRMRANLRRGRKGF